MLKLRDIMTSEVLTLTPDLPLRRAVELFVRHHVSGAPVVRGRTVVGVLTASDILGLETAPPPICPACAGSLNAADAVDALPDDADADARWDYFPDDGFDLAERLAAEEPEDGETLDEQTVDAAMTREILTLPGGVSVRDGAAFMAKHSIHRVFVEEKGKLVGIVTTTDVTRAVGECGLGVMAHR